MKYGGIELNVIIDLLIQIIVGVIIFILGYISQKIYKIIYFSRPLQKIWGFENKKEEICVVTGNIEHGVWKHLMATGDIRTYGEVMSVLRNNYKKELVNNFFSKEFHPHQLRKYNVISIGGPKWNWVTRKILEELGNPFKFDLENGQLVDRRYNPPKRYDVEIENRNNGVKADYGIIIKTTNPYKNDKNILIFMGYTTYGVLAAVRCLSEFKEYIMKNKNLKERFLNSKNYSVVVRTTIIRDEIGEEEVHPEIIEDSFIEFKMEEIK